MIKKKAMKKKPINKTQVQDEPVQKIETLEEIEQVRLRYIEKLKKEKKRHGHIRKRNGSTRLF